MAQRKDLMALKNRDTNHPIEYYEHKSKKHVNNPLVGTVMPSLPSPCKPFTRTSSQSSFRYYIFSIYLVNYSDILGCYAPAYSCYHFEYCFVCLLQGIVWSSKIEKCCHENYRSNVRYRE